MSRPYAPSLYTDEALIAEIKEYQAAVKTLAKGDIAVIAGEGRRVEYTRGSSGALASALREMYAEARRRGLDIGGTGGAIGVDFS